MRASRVAEELGISERSVYRLIRDGTFKAKVKIRDSPILGYAVSEKLVSALKLKFTLQGEIPTPAKIREIMREVVKHDIKV